MGLMVFGGLMTIPNLAVAAPAGKESVEIKKYDTLNAAAEEKIQNNVTDLAEIKRVLGEDTGAT